MQLGFVVAVIPLSAACPGKSAAGGAGKFDFYCSKGHRLAYHSFNDHVNLVLSEKCLYKFKLMK